MTSREKFEAWISSPPYEKSVARFPEDGTYWPGMYGDYKVQLAFEAWEEASKATLGISKPEEVHLPDYWPDSD